MAITKLANRVVWRPMLGRCSMGNSLFIVHTVMLLERLQAGASAAGSPAAADEALALLAPGYWRPSRRRCCWPIPTSSSCCSLGGLDAGPARCSRGLGARIGCTSTPTMDGAWSACGPMTGWTVALAGGAVRGHSAALDLQGVDESRYEPTLELALILASGYLFGRSTTACLRRADHHADLHEP